MDVIGEVLMDYHNGRDIDTLLLHNNYGEPEEMPVEVFFRDEDDMPDIELCAMDICEGSVLDIGAGVGMHALILQDRGYEVTALEISIEALEIMAARGVLDTVESDIFFFKSKKYDTLLLLMNGIGIVGTVKKLEKFLDHAKTLLNPDGQILLDSSDITYLYEDIARPEDKYFGELRYRYEYKGKVGEWFDWLYIDQKLLEEIANKKGFDFQVIFEDDDDHYLARLSLQSI